MNYVILVENKFRIRFSFFCHFEYILIDTARNVIIASNNDDIYNTIFCVPVMSKAYYMVICSTGKSFKPSGTIVLNNRWINLRLR